MGTHTESINAAHTRFRVVTDEDDTALEMYDAANDTALLLEFDDGHRERTQLLLRIAEGLGVDSRDIAIAFDVGGLAPPARTQMDLRSQLTFHRDRPARVTDSFVVTAEAGAPYGESEVNRDLAVLISATESLSEGESAHVLVNGPEPGTKIRVEVSVLERGEPILTTVAGNGLVVHSNVYRVDPS